MFFIKNDIGDWFNEDIPITSEDLWKKHDDQLTCALYEHCLVQILQMLEKYPDKTLSAMFLSLLKKPVLHQ